MADDDFRDRAQPIVDWDHTKPLLYNAHGQPLRRQAGFLMAQTSGVMPPLYDNTKKTVKTIVHPRKPKKGCK